MLNPRIPPIARPGPVAKLVAALAVALGFGSALGATPEVAEVTLMVGEARVLRANGSTEALQRGARIHVGDRVQTAANGHVHMRFIDNAAVSVRPESVLEVEAYRYDPQDPKANEVRFRVEKGTARSISGAATDVDKSRFRLNTPIAAIGVRGTDFIVRSDVDSVRATVADGVIVVGAFGPGCAAAAVGPCAGNDVRELSADMGRLMAEVKVGDRVTRIVPAMESFSGNVNGSREFGTRQSAMAAARSSGMAAAEPTAGEMLRGNDSTAADLLTLAKVNMPDLNRPSDFDAQLIWGRWGIVPSGDDQVSVPFSFARIGRHVTVADEDFGLFRANQAGSGALFPDTLNATVEFHLTRASATFDTGTSSEGATVTASNLTVDFARRSFATGLDLMAATSGVTGELRAAGEIRPDGIFSVRDNGQRVSGAVSFDGREAGYLFERSAGGGLFRGITLWGN